MSLLAEGGIPRRVKAAYLADSDIARHVAAHLIEHKRPVNTRVRMLWPPSMNAVERWWLA
jgi:hypothetical protein